MSRYVLDTSALFAFIENEEGAQEVETLLIQTIEGRHELAISMISEIEVYYISLREQGEEIASERLRLLNDLPITQEVLDSDLIRVIGNLKAGYSLSFADCCIAGLAQDMGAVLVHKDPEFEAIEHLVTQYKLPYKAKA
ncbi:PilT protein domain protein [Candidatus Moduliflexus flocculans]|uniref:Ribonuclease VapC n=1 Tax=Candidatus Moduliflexus flocculans TaxID=1499966 RepID=A0A0S6W3Y2_9BACT|nr:PilT protein domain protein [Candidatus Moduliflexus flocculans]